jgi:L-amino acid N-acyltransferase YncA
MELIPLEPTHWEQVKKIYLEGIASGDATFQTSAPSWSEWNEGHLKHSRLVVLINKEIVGWAALTAVSGRCVYAGVAEVSVYVGETFRGKGIGKELLEELVKTSERNGLWTLQAGIFPENTGSLRIHEACGFQRIGVRRKIGQLNGTWRDTVLLERRSTVVGI